MFKVSIHILFNSKLTKIKLFLINTITGNIQINFDDQLQTISFPFVSDIQGMHSYSSQFKLKKYSIFI